MRNPLRRIYFVGSKWLTRAWQQVSYRVNRLISRRAEARLLRRGKPDWRDIPVVINNCNRVTYLRQLVDWLERVGCRRIIILDNDSTYAPLLQYYKETPHEVVLLGANLGHLALWRSPVFARVRDGFFIYTDPDLVPDDACPDDAIAVLLDTLLKDPEIQKIGLGLRLDDLPDHYDKRDDVVIWERQFWSNPYNKDFFVARVDTTLALYRPRVRRYRFQPSLRSGPPYLLRHLPWYENSASLTEEQQYYYDNIRPSSTWWGPLARPQRDALIENLRKSKQKDSSE